MLWYKVQKLLIEKNMSINQLSLKMGLSKNNRTMYQLRDGKIKKPSFELMCKIADALDVSLDYFRKRDDQMTTKLRELRLKKGLSQKAVAEKLQISPSMLAMMELGDRRGGDSTKVKLANFYGVSVESLFLQIYHT